MAFTENHATSLASTLDARLNLFFKTVRNLGNFADAIPYPRSTPKNEKKDRDDISYEDTNENLSLYKLIEASWAVDNLDTMKILMNWRDCRGGKGDYSGFLVAMAYLWKCYPVWLQSNFKLIPFFGCWLDLIKLWHIAPESKAVIMQHIVTTLQSDLTNMQSGMGEVSLLAKWIPSENSKWDRFTDDRFCIALCHVLFTVPVGTRITGTHLQKLRKDYLTPLRSHIEIVETKMCENNYGGIEYAKVPSVAMNKYKCAFFRNDTERFQQYLTNVANGKEKIKAGQMYPHDLVRQYLTLEKKADPVVEAQWKEIKTKVQTTGAFRNSICVVDVSSSMSGTPMEVAIALGLLSIDANNDKVITFSETPQLHRIAHGTLWKQTSSIKLMKWGMNTDLERVLDLVLGMVIGGSTIERVFIFSDMQFDQATRRPDLTLFENYKAMFAASGARLPQIVFWNLRGDTHDFPVSCNEHGVLMLSGYSPSLLRAILDKDDITPMTVMFKIIHDPRYDVVHDPRCD